MPIAGLETDLVRSTHEAGFSPAQGLCSKQSRALNPHTYLTEHTGSSCGIATTLARAMVVLDSHARTGQPVLEELRIASNYATQTVDGVIGLLGGDATLLSIRGALQLTPMTADPPGSRQNRSGAQRASAGLAVCVSERSLRSIERRLFDLTWSAAPADDEAWGRHELASQHLASLIDLRGRHAASLVLSIANATRSTSRSADSIYRCLSPETSLFQVVVVVEGTTALDGLARLIPVQHDPNRLRSKRQVETEDAASLDFP